MDTINLPTPRVGRLAGGRGTDAEDQLAYQPTTRSPL